MEKNEKLEEVAKKAAEKFEKDSEKISALVEKAEALIDRAIAISEKTGTPFQIGIGGIYQTYRPESFAEEFAKEANEYFVDEEGEFDEWHFSDWKRDQIRELADFDVPYESGWDSAHWNISIC